MSNKKSIYFASDFHLGTDTTNLTSRQREDRIVHWLKSIKDQCAILYLVGDIFDYWFEYKEVVPKGYVRLFGILSEYIDIGIQVIVFTGNHDMWMFDYLQKEIGVKVINRPIIASHFNKNIYIAHGDGLGPGDYKYKLVKRILANKICQWLFHRLHPNLGLYLMRKMSSTSRHFDSTPSSIRNMEKERMVIHSRTILQNHQIDYFIYGHRHFPTEYKLSESTSVLYLGDWMHTFTYGILESNGELKLHYYKK
jgi:UDP-2,3-diacylglucosamine hydrolase